MTIFTVIAQQLVALPHGVLIAMYVLIAAAAMQLIFWATVAFKIRSTMRTLPTLRDGVTLASTMFTRERPPPTLCVIVPAHNEERCIEEVAVALANQDYPQDRLRVVFVLDRCTDRTAEILRTSVGHLNRFCIHEVGTALEGWSGKTGALQRGFDHHRGARLGGQDAEITLFLDADTIPGRSCLRAAAALLHDRGLDMLSILSTLTADAWFERVAQPVAGMEIVRHYPLLRANSPRQRRPFANGQFIMVRTDVFRELGCWSAVKAAILEDVEFARHAHRAGRPIGLLLAGGLLHCRMYPDYERFVTGWKRVFSECANRKPRRLRTQARRLLGLGVVLPLLTAICLGAGIGVLPTDPPLGVVAVAVGAVSMAVWLAVLAWAYRLAAVPSWCALSYPAGAVRVARIMFAAAADLDAGRPTRWAGMEYEVAARK
jgi:glycosyltransferase involved in cell wall biosynthesis